MKVRVLYIVAVLLIILACNGKKDSEQMNMQEHKHGGHEMHSDAPGSKKYTCPMHPEIIKDEPGQCPICNMDLVEMKVDEGINTESRESGIGLLLKPTNEYVISQVKTVAMKYQTVLLMIPVTGRIEYDTREIATISSKVEGRIEKLYVKYLYQPVNKGQKLMDIYSKELLTEQENFIYLLKNDPDNSALIKSAGERLALQGLTSEQINYIKVHKKPIEFISIFSPLTGHLHELTSINTSGMSAMNTASQKELLVREGMYVQKGQTIFSIYNTNKLWALLDVYEENLSFISTGQKVNLFVDDKELEGDYKIDFLEPSVKPGQKTISARVYFNNMYNVVKVGSNVKGNIDAGTKEGYFVPAKAIVNLGTNHIVFIKEKNMFRAHKVNIGIKADDNIEIVSGLEKNDLIAENAQLLMDSESFVKFEN